MRTRYIILSICLIGISSLFSCQPHKEPIDYSLKAGNIYCSNGNIVPPNVYEENMNGIGVIVTIGKEEDNFSAIAVAKEDIGYYAYADTLMDLETNGEYVTFDGKENTAILIAGSIEKDEYDVPAAKAAYSYIAGIVSGWHLPSAGELKDMAAKKGVVKHSLELIGGKWLDEEEWYQSSTQDASNDETKQLYNLNVSSGGRVKASLKTESRPVRPFIVIQ